MFIDKLIHQRSFIRILSGLIFLLVLVAAGLLDSFLVVHALPPHSPTLTASDASPNASSAVSYTSTWPNSDSRLDVADGRNAEIDQVISGSLHNISIVRSFGVPDNVNILTTTKTGPPYKLQYNWDYSCKGTHERPLEIAQSNFISSYYPTFFDSTVIDSATQYRRFLKVFQPYNPNTLIGYYSSSTACLEGPTSPYAENYYPPNAVDCHRLAPPYSPSMNTRPWSGQSCPAVPVKWYVNVGDPQIRTRFRDILIQNTKAITPIPSFVFLDNVEFWDFSKGDYSDCRLWSSVGDGGCKTDHKKRAEQFGPNIYMDDYLEHYDLLLTSLQKLGVRAILNINRAAPLAYPKEGLTLTKQFEDILGKNGLNFELPFDPHTRETVANTTAVITLYKSLLDNGNLVIFGEYGDEAQSTWQAAMAMMIRERGQSLFVMRNDAPTNWISWTAQYSMPMGAATPITSPKLSVDRSGAGQHWVTSRTFITSQTTISREIMVVSFGVKKNGVMTFPLSQVVPQLNKSYTVTYSSLTPEHLPTHVDLDWSTGVYTAPLSLKPNEDTYFILGADCDKNKFCTKLITVAVHLFP